MYRKLSLTVVVVFTLLPSGMIRAAGLDITAPRDTVQGVPNDGVTDGSGNFGWPGHEHPALAIDDDTSTKYLHFKGETQYTGFQVTPSAGQTIVVGLTFTTANDAVARDPVAFEFYGSNVSINGPYTLIASGDIVDFSQATPWPRFTKNETPVFFDNDVAYDHYQVLFTAVRNPGSANSMQISEVELIGKYLTAANPDPFDGAVIRDTWVNLSWLSGDSAGSHDVYFGESFAEVYRSAGDTFRGNQHSNDFLVGLPGHPCPGGLVPGTTYYWRVDEFDGALTHKGDVWSFTIMPADASERPSTVSTFHCIGVYWSPQDGGSNNVCQVRYRSHGSTAWKEALSLWYDDRGVGGYSPGYRGSIVNLDPGTVYEIELELSKTGTEEELIAETWSEDFPITKTVYLPAGTTNQPLEITESGSPEGYILYTAPAGGAAIDVRHNRDYCITVNASYIIIRGLDLKGAEEYGIRLYDCHDVVIEGCDISDFSRIEDDGWGNRGAAIFSLSTKLERIIVQRNKMHHPYSDTNSWSEYRDKYGSYHPRGPKPIGYVNSAGNHVIRYNEIYSDGDHYFEDCISSGSNNFPNRDSDIYGNYVANCWDDGIEAEGDDCNVRIWGNFIEWTYVKIAVAPTNVGPVYIWRNVTGVARKDDIQPWNDVSRGGFLKTSDIGGGGKIYVFHNTLLQPEQPRGVQYPLGCGRGFGHGGPMLNTMSRNNILHIHNPGAPSIKDRNYDPLGNYDYDLYNGYIDARPGAERNGINGVPIYDLNNGDGEFALDPFSPGYDAGEAIPNFNDNYNGAAPDIGAYEADSPPMEFGVDAYK
ncbi:MAG: right-handed parallel beta-helix repeat-containing protein [Planctomycetota bacterium]